MASSSTPTTATTLITAYRSAGTLREAVTSALAQDGDRVLVVIDGDVGTHGADADAVAACELLDDGFRRDDVTVLTPGRVGRSRALNIGLTHVTTDHVAVLDADDRSLPGRNERQSAYLDAHRECVAVGGQLLSFTRDPRRGELDHASSPAYVAHRVGYPTDPADIDARLARGRMPLAHPALMYRTSWALGLGGYDESLTRCEDLDLVLRGWRAGTFAALAVPVTAYHVLSTFPTWQYWRLEESTRRLVLRRSGDNAGNRTTPRVRRCAESADDLLRWLVQRTLAQGAGRPPHSGSHAAEVSPLPAAPARFLSRRG